MRRRRKNPISPDWITWGLIAVGVFVIYKIVTGAKNVLTNATSAAGSSVADLFPNNIVAPGSGGSFTVTQPDGSTVTVPAGWKQGDPIPYDTSQAAGTDTGGGMI
jgi:hypothetical protein